MSQPDPSPTQPIPATPTLEQVHEDHSSHRRETLLILWLILSVGCFIVYAVYSSRRVTGRSEPRQPIALPKNVLPSAQTPPENDPSLLHPQADGEFYLTHVHATEQRLRHQIKAKYRVRKNLPGAWEGEQRRLSRIAELKKVLANVTDFPAGSVQWHIRAELESLQRNDFR